LALSNEGRQNNQEPTMPPYVEKSDKEIPLQNGTTCSATAWSLQLLWF
jgi:hypothetical protein